MKKRTQYIIFFVTFIPVFLASLYVSFELLSRSMRGIFFIASVHHDCFGMADESCQYESVQISCPSLSKEKQSGLATVTISNPHDIEREYGGSINAIILEQEDQYNQESICSEKLTIAPHQTGSFTCEVDQRTVEGEILLLQVFASPTGVNCAGTVNSHCSIQSYYDLYCIIPSVVCIPFLVWLAIIELRKERAQPEPDSDPGDV
jgi:hypothetical protein